MISERVASLPGVAAASVEITWDQPWSTDRLSDDARAKLRFLPHPNAMPAGRGTAMIGDAIVFDDVAHVVNFDKKNALGPAGDW